MKKQKAFTLIELLIVVAIIAILAAIAVPNFLEAQIRSKVSRAHADMRSIATALEAYAVDHNHYPPSYKMLPPQWIHGWWPRLVPLTTPVAYITSVPFDPFAVGAMKKADPPITDPSEVRLHSTYGYAEDYWGYYPADIFPKGLVDWDGTDIRWQLASAGPDYELNYRTNVTNEGDMSWGQHHSMPYDATNGSRSDGDVLRGGGSGVDGNGRTF